VLLELPATDGAPRARSSRAPLWWFTLTAAIGYLAWRFFHYDALIIPLVVGVIVWKVASHFLEEHWKEIRETLRREKEEGAS